jgi:hypothetical protein
MAHADRFSKRVGELVDDRGTWNITPDFQVNPAIYFPNYQRERILGYIVFK